MRRMISAILSMILVGVAAYAAGAYINAVERPEWPFFHHHGPKDPVAAKYDLEARATPWLCPSVTALRDGRLPEIFAPLEFDPKTIGNEVKWGEVAFSHNQAMDAQFASSSGLGCTYGGRFPLFVASEKGAPTINSFELKLREEFVAEVSFNHMEPGWGEHWVNTRFCWDGTRPVFDPVTNEVENTFVGDCYPMARCEKSREDCPFFVRRQVIDAENN